MSQRIVVAYFIDVADVWYYRLAEVDEAETGRLERAGEVTLPLKGVPMEFLIIGAEEEAAAPGADINLVVEFKDDSLLSSENMARFIADFFEEDAEWNKAD